MLELVRVRFHVVRHVRPRFACACCDRMVQAPAISRPIARGYAGPALLAHIMTSKYQDHLPLRSDDVVSGKSVSVRVDLVGRRIIKQKRTYIIKKQTQTNNKN